MNIAAGYVNRRVLITGAGGSIGSELACLLYAAGNRDLVLLDRDGSHLHQLELRMMGTGLLQNPQFVLADIRDSDTLMEIFRNYQPEIVVHAAALKHVPLLERFPEEAWKTNVLGTLSVLRAANVVGVTEFINISTDKAAEATTVLGKSKALAEQLTLAFAEGETVSYNQVCACLENSRGRFSQLIESESDVPVKRRYVNVRFGNVVGSRGSVSETFKYQIQHGLPVTVTTEDSYRFLMSVAEACELILASLEQANNAETVVLKMGQQVRITDFAREIMSSENKHVPIEIVGNRVGDKLRETLLDTGDSLTRETQTCWFVISQRRKLDELTSEAIK
ncbi:polysaccharide biosynthesis protein [Gleimia coleocanis DSM 15436]|uniref:Polysaccharide biosynthesis protein n=1 Tax=Gleimia coleocanis DSM 15436 TaxID=525245 RepID=C0VYC9_9ACTO|nr:polysaccharide biosynthesis protein [Gleimia coleocanis]EEH64432.1 polysaccharide biosynthesis protein [Gleimia coleocanis DSM 15436]